MGQLDFHHRFVPGHSGTPALLLLHGTGGNEDDLLELGRFLSPGAPLLSPRGRVSENGKNRFFARFAEGVFDVEDVKLRSAELADFVLQAAAAYGLENKVPIAVGYSNGANVAAALLLLRPGVLAGAVLLHAMVPIVPDTPPALNGIPVFISGGNDDPMVPPFETERLARLLESAGASVRLYRQPGGHEVSHSEITAAGRWLAEILRSRA